MTMKLLASVLAVFAVGAVNVAGEPVLSLVGPSSPVTAGQTFLMDVRITGVADLAYYQFDVGYNPALVSGLLVEEGPFLPSAGPTLFIPGTIDDLLGLIGFTAGALVGTGPGASGDGVLATLTFEALSPGTASFTLLSPLLYNSVPDPIAFTAAGATVPVEPSPVPEPATLTLAGVSLSVVAVAFRRLASACKR